MVQHCKDNKHPLHSQMITYLEYNLPGKQGAAQLLTWNINCSKKWNYLFPYWDVHSDWDEISGAMMHDWNIHRVLNICADNLNKFFIRRYQLLYDIVIHCVDCNPSDKKLWSLWHSMIHGVSKQGVHYENVSSKPEQILLMNPL